MLSISFLQTVLFVFVSCMQATFGGTDCNEPYSCSGSLAASGWLSCNGFLSCADSILESGTSVTAVSCGGSRSCQKSTLVSSTFYGEGYLGLAWSNPSATESGLLILDCVAEASCFGIDAIPDGYKMTCDGVRSCSNVTGAFVTIVEGFGMFSLAFSEFYSYISDASDDTVVTVDLYGFFAGFGASFTCRSGYTCEIDCASTGCVNFNLLCEDGASCTVECDNVDVICPNDWALEPNNTYVFDMSDFGNLLYSNELISSFLTKVYCESPSNECVNNDDVISLLGCDTDEYTGCTDASISVTVDDSFCVNAWNPLCCGTGFKFGQQPQGDTVDTLYCDGSVACYAIIPLSGNSAQARGSFSGGLFSEFDTVVATSGEAFYYNDVKNGDVLGCFGSNSCQDLRFGGIKNVSTVYATGYSALKNSVVQSGGSNVDVVLLGYKSGDDFELTCTGTDVCTIYGLDDSYFSNMQAVCDFSNECTINYATVDELIGEIDIDTITSGLTSTSTVCTGTSSDSTGTNLASTSGTGPVASIGTTGTTKETLDSDPVEDATGKLVVTYIQVYSILTLIAAAATEL